MLGCWASAREKLAHLHLFKYPFESQPSHCSWSPFPPLSPRHTTACWLVAWTCVNLLFFGASLVHVRKVEISLLSQPAECGKCFIFLQTEAELSYHRPTVCSRTWCAAPWKVYLYSCFSFLNIIQIVSAAHTQLPFQLLMAVADI